MSGHEKAAGVLDTPATANFKIDTPIVAPNRESEKSFDRPHPAPIPWR